MQSEGVSWINNGACELYSLSNEIYRETIQTDNEYQNINENSSQDYDILSEVTIQINNETHTLYVGPVKIKSSEHVQNIQSYVGTYAEGYVNNKAEPQQQTGSSILQTALQKPLAVKQNCHGTSNNNTITPKQIREKNEKFRSLTDKTQNTSHITSKDSIISINKPTKNTYCSENSIISNTEKKTILIEIDSSCKLENNNKTFPNLVELANYKHTDNDLAESNKSKNNPTSSCCDIHNSPNSIFLNKINNSSEISVSKVNKTIKHSINDISDNYNSTFPANNTIDLMDTEIAAEGTNNCQNKAILNHIRHQDSCFTDDIISTDIKSHYENDISEINLTRSNTERENSKSECVQRNLKTERPESKLKSSILKYLKTQQFNKPFKPKIPRKKKQKAAIVLNELQRLSRKKFQDNNLLKFGVTFDFPIHNKTSALDESNTVINNSSLIQDLNVKEKTETNISEANNRLKSIKNCVKEKSKGTLKNEIKTCVTNTKESTTNVNSNSKKCKLFLRKQNSEKSEIKKTPVKVDTKYSEETNKQKNGSHNENVDELSNNSMEKRTETVPCPLENESKSLLCNKFEEKFETETEDILDQSTTKSTCSIFNVVHGNINDKIHDNVADECSKSSVTIYEKLSTSMKDKINKNTKSVVKCVNKSVNEIKEEITIEPKVSRSCLSVFDNHTYKSFSLGDRETITHEDTDASFKLISLSDWASNNNTSKEGTCLGSDLSTNCKQSVTNKAANKKVKQRRKPTKRFPRYTKNIEEISVCSPINVTEECTTVSTITITEEVSTPASVMINNIAENTTVTNTIGDCVDKCSKDIAEKITNLLKQSTPYLSTSGNNTTETKSSSNRMQTITSDGTEQSSQLTLLPGCISNSNTEEQAPFKLANCEATVTKKVTIRKPKEPRKSTKHMSRHIKQNEKCISSSLMNLDDVEPHNNSSTLDKATSIKSEATIINVSGILHGTICNSVSKPDVQGNTLSKSESETKTDRLVINESVPYTENVKSIDEFHENQNNILEENATTELIQGIIDNLAECKENDTDLENCIPLVADNSKTLSDKQIVKNKILKNLSDGSDIFITRKRRRNTLLSGDPPRKSRRLLHPTQGRESEEEEQEEEEYVNVIYTNYQNPKSRSYSSETVGKHSSGGQRVTKRNNILQKSDIVGTSESDIRKVIGSRDIEDGDEYVPDIRAKRKRKLIKQPKVFRKEIGTNTTLRKISKSNQIADSGIVKHKKIEKNNKSAKVQNKSLKTKRLNDERILRSEIVVKQLVQKNSKSDVNVKKKTNGIEEEEEQAIELAQMVTKTNTTDIKKSSITDYFSSKRKSTTDKPVNNQMKIPEENIKSEIPVNSNQKYSPVKNIQKNIQNLPLPEVNSIKLENYIPKPVGKICKICNLQFTNSGTLTTHIKRVHIKLKNKECTYCKRAFTCTGDLTRHIRTHTGEKPFLCEFSNCGKRFITSGALFKHKRIKHNGQTKTRCHLCTKCNKAFERPYDLRRHMMSHELNNPEFNAFVCAICKKKFARRDELTSHLKRHAGIKDYKCQCGKAFTDSSNFNKHLRMSGHKRDNATLNGNPIKD